MERPSKFAGEWIESGDAAYEELRKVFNTRVDAHPKVIARCRDTADVVAAVKHARSAGLPLTVRCTGYSQGGFSAGDGEFVIDLSLMRGIEIDPELRVARVEGGMRGGELQTKATSFGLGAPTGTLPGTGVGLLLGGGMGHIMSRIGYGSDNILAFELVTADGDIVQASPDENPDLFWAVRGSTGNFGIVTWLDLRLHEVPETVLAGRMMWPFDDLDGAMQTLRESWEWAPDDLSLVPALTTTALDGRGGLEVWFCHIGEKEQARADVERLRGNCHPEQEDVREFGFRDYHFLFESEYPPMRVILDEQPVDSVSDELIKSLVGHMRQDAGTGMHSIEVIPRLGALGRDPAHPSALRDTGEDQAWAITPAAFWDDPAEDESHDRWVDDVISTVRSIGPTNERKHPNGVAVRMDLEGVARMYGDRFDRLRSIKRQWDPDNVFRGAHNIPPAES